MFVAKIQTLLDRIEARPHSFAGLLAVCAFTGIVRSIEEYLFFSEKLAPAMGIAMAMAYFQIALGLILALHLINRIEWKRAQNAVYIGIFLGIFPPVIDLAVYGFNATVIYRYYVEGNLADMPYHFFAPQQGAPAGEAITVWLSILFAGAYSMLRGGSVLKVLGTLLAVYTFMLLQFSFLPRALVHFVNMSAGGSLQSGESQAYVSRIAMSFLPFWYLTLSFAFYLVMRPSLRTLLWSRLPHFMPFILIALAGGHYTGGLRVEVYLAATAVLILAGTAAVQNDYFDLPGVAKSFRPEKCDLDFMNIFSGGLMIWLLLLGFNSVLPLIIIAIGSILYNYPQFRLRRIFPASLKIEGLWAAMAFLSGVLIFDRSNLRPSIVVIIALLFGGWSVVAAWKDLKDIRSDIRKGYQNLYTFLLVRRGYNLHRAHRLVSGAIIACFSIPVLYATVTQQWMAAVALTVVGLVPVFGLSYRPGMQDWFRIVLWIFSAEILVMLLWLRL